MPGYSPGISLVYDLPLARSLLAKAGYPDDRGFPSLSGIFTHPRNTKAITASWQVGLGIKIKF